MNYTWRFFSTTTTTTIIVYNPLTNFFFFKKSFSVKNICIFLIIIQTNKECFFFQMRKSKQVFFLKKKVFWKVSVWIGKPFFVWIKLIVTLFIIINWWWQIDRLDFWLIDRSIFESDTWLVLSLLPVLFQTKTGIIDKKRGK